MNVGELGLKVDTSEAVAKLDALTKAANRATEALKAFSDAYEEIGHKTINVSVEAEPITADPAVAPRYSRSA
ncbi:MAG: hypothetical protein RLW68_01805 [Devosia marina]|uniref:hypothetical protein n=1 Tax=Devosia marina TaxID=2683198 RepID=UPI0032EC166E